MAALAYVSLLAVQAASGAPHLSATRAPAPPVLDGRLDDSVWAASKSTRVFTQKIPDDGAPPTEKTTLRVLYDDDAIYVGVECEQRGVPVVRPLTRRDRRVESDSVTIALDTKRDRKSAFEFSVSAGGVLFDALRYNDTDFSSDWDENWDARTATTADGWSAEIRIPLRILRFDSKAVQSWGFQARRYISKRQETDEWAYVPRHVAGEVSNYGRLDDLVGLRPKNGLEVRPFVLARLRHRDPAADVIANGTDFAASAGGDLKWHITQDATLDATINPDFAQVEADQVVLNLSNTETYYPEKRPFFLEGKDVFATPVNLVYTRRIGRVAPTPALRRGEVLYDPPTPATILGAYKLVARIDEAWTIGVLSALSARNDVGVQLADGRRDERLADPLTSHNVVRVKRELGSRAMVGVIATATTRAETTAAHPVADGAPLAPPRALCPTGKTLSPGERCLHNAYVGGVDALWRSDNGDYIVGGQALASVIQRGPPRTFSDGTVIESGNLGPGVSAFAFKEGGAHWVGGVEGGYAGRKLDVNDLGYLQRQNQWSFFGVLEYRDLQPWWRTRETRSRFEVFRRWNLDGLPLASGYQLNTEWKLQNFWRVFTELHIRPARFDDREIGDGTALERKGLLGHELSVSSDPTSRISGRIGTTAQLISGGTYLAARATLTLRALPQLDVELLPEASYQAGEPRYAGTAADPNQYIFGRLTAKTLGATLRATYTFTPRLTLQTYAQLFLDSGHYKDFTSFTVAPTAPRPAIRVADLQANAPPPTSNPDFQSGALNVNVVLRWEYLLGSTLFVVYSRAQTPTTSLAPGEVGVLDVGAVRRAPATDIFLVKMSHWFG